MTTKLKIDLSQGILEVEGSEVFVKAIYSDFKAQFVGDETGEELSEQTPPRRRRSRKARKTVEVSPAASTLDQAVPAPEAEPAKVEPVPQTPTPVTPDLKLPAKKPEYNFLEELELSSTNSHPSLVEFMDAKFPITNEERNLVFLYYLQYKLDIKAITIDHIYTCYRAAKIRVPLNIEHSVQSTAEQHRWIKVAKNGHLSLTPSGKLYVEKQLPKTRKS
jgi:hypothetical protein